MGNEILVWSLLEKGADTPARYRDETILCEAVVEGNGSIVKFLIESGADPFVAALEGVILLELAQREGYESIGYRLEIAMHGKMGVGDGCKLQA